MKRAIRILAWASFAGFMVLTLWRGIFQGVMEKPSFAVNHLDAGAGDWGLIIQFLIAVLTFAFGSIWLFTGSRTKEKVIALAMVLLTPALFFFCARGLQKFAPKYSETAFQQLIESHQSNGPLKNTEVVAVLGEPLMRRQAPFGGETWLYSYMPSCGFGWDKKYVFIDPAGQVTDIYSFSEP